MMLRKVGTVGRFVMLSRMPWALKSEDDDGGSEVTMPPTLVKKLEIDVLVAGYKYSGFFSVHHEKGFFSSFHGPLTQQS